MNKMAAPVWIMRWPLELTYETARNNCCISHLSSNFILVVLTSNKLACGSLSLTVLYLLFVLSHWWMIFVFHWCWNILNNKPTLGAQKCRQVQVLSKCGLIHLHGLYGCSYRCMRLPNKLAKPIVPAPTLTVGVNAVGQHHVIDFPSASGEQQQIVYPLQAFYEWNWCVLPVC